MHPIKRSGMRCFSVAASAFLLLTGAWAPAGAELRPAGAEVTRMTGRVEILRRGQVGWTAASLGARLVEGDQIRVMGGGSSELSIPDGSTVLIAENTRFAVVKLEYDEHAGNRNMAFQLVAGKVRAEVAHAPVQRARAQRSNFTISTPTGVAVVRGTVVVQLFDPATGQSAMFVLPSPGQDPATAQATYVDRATGRPILVQGGQFITQTGTTPPSAPTPISNLPAAARQQLQTVANTATADQAALTAPTVTTVSPAQVEALLAAVGVNAAVAPAVVVTVETIPTTPTPTSSVGRDSTVTQQQSCASPPCP
jgi:hypothetical protein